MTPLLERHFYVTLIELVALQVTIIVACCKVHLIGVAAFDEGGGIDSSNVEVVKGDDTLSGAAGEVGRGAVGVEVVGGPAETASSIVRAFPTIMAGILAVAGETVEEWG
jgi:hypothetical protein